jgi:hypothetical protein
MTLATKATEVTMISYHDLIVDENAEEEMGQEVYTIDHINSGVQPRAQNGQIKQFKTHAEHSQLSERIKSVPEDHFSHWQNLRRDIVLEK